MATADWRCDSAGGLDGAVSGQLVEGRRYSVDTSVSKANETWKLERPLNDNRLMRLCYCPEVAGMGLMSWLCRWFGPIEELNKGP